jgi:hypothetical protein
MQAEMFAEWKDHEVTQALVARLKEDIELLFNALSRETDITSIHQLQGRIAAARSILNLTSEDL